MQSALPKTKIKDFKKNFFLNAPAIITKPIEKKQLLFKPPVFIIGVHAGMGYLTARIAESVPSELYSYFDRLRWGYHIGIDLQTFNKNFGLGFKYTLFNTSNSTNISTTDNVTGQIKYGILAENINVQFYGPTFNFSTSSATGRWYFISDFSIGKLYYQDYLTYYLSRYIITGKTIGIYFDLFLNLRFLKFLSANIGISSLSGSINKFDLNHGNSISSLNLPGGEREGLSRVEFSFGLKCFF